MKFPDGQAELSPCYQEYRMECLICGLGEDSISILPKDPRKVSQILFQKRDNKKPRNVEIKDKS